MICQICQKKEATNVCMNCGARVCDDHFDKTTGLCTKCRRGKQL